MSLNNFNIKCGQLSADYYKAIKMIYFNSLILFEFDLLLGFYILYIIDKLLSWNNVYIFGDQNQVGSLNAI